MIGHKNNISKGTKNAPIPEDNEQYCFRMPLKLEVHKRYWTTLCAFLAAIGKRFGDAELADVLIENGIVASGSVAGVIEGRHYNRAVRTHKVHTVC